MLGKLRQQTIGVVTKHSDLVVNRATKSPAGRKPRVAFFAPLSPMRGGVVDYSEELLPHLAAHADIDIFTHHGLQPDNAALTRVFAIHSQRDFIARDRLNPYDQVIYQLGNHSDHVQDYDALQRRPGLTVWHELNLGGIVGAKTFGRGGLFKYLYFRFLRHNEGVEAWRSAVRDFVLTRKFPGPFAYDFSRRAVQQSVGLIVHTFFMRDALLRKMQAWGFERPVTRVAPGIPVPPEPLEAEVSAVRRHLNVPSGAPLIGAFGIIHASKGVDVALRAFARGLAEAPEAVFVMVGEMQDPAIAALIEQLGLSERVRITGFVPMEDFNHYVAACDVCVNLRVPQTGGASGALLRLMAAGRPVIVSNQAQFAELPDEVCLKAATGAEAEASVYAHLRSALQNPDRARRIGRAARDFICAEHTLEQAALGYRAAILASLEGR